jgi:hypothetical protein
MRLLVTALSVAFLVAEAPKETQTVQANQSPKLEQKRTERRQVIMPDGRVMNLWYDEKLGRTVTEP